MRKIGVFLSLFLFATLATGVHADAVTTYNFTTTLSDSSTVNGQFTLDVVSNTSATITQFAFTDPTDGVSIAYPVWSSFVGVYYPATSPSADVVQILFYNTDTGPAGAYLSLDFTTDLTDFDPSSIDTGAIVAPGPVFVFNGYSCSTIGVDDGSCPAYLESPFAAPSVSAVPEPGTLSLTTVAFGLLGLMTVMRKRLAKVLPEAT